jgi:16S rRNA (cytosine967-C5)-methyltransferase
LTTGLAAIDYLIEHFSKRSLARLDPEVVDILRLSAYQLLHLSRVPASAAVDDAVKLTGKVGKRSASGLVNAVLRALSRNRSSLPLPARPADDPNGTAPSTHLSTPVAPRGVGALGFDRIGLERARSLDAVQSRVTLTFGPIR